MLKVENLTISFGGFCVFKDVNLTLIKEKITGLIGPNGAGKTTLFNAISGFVKPKKGKIEVDGIDITTKPIYERRHLGIVRTFQQVKLFENHTVEENLLMALKPQKLKDYFIIDHNSKVKVKRILLFSNLLKYQHIKLKNLPFGIRRFVQVAIAILCKPTYLLLDEPAAGLNYSEQEKLSRLILKTIQKFKCGIIIVDHNMDFIMNLVDDIYVLANKKILAYGKPCEITHNREVIKVYLGE